MATTSAHEFTAACSHESARRPDARRTGSPHACGSSRRDVLTGLLALGASTALLPVGERPALAQAAKGRWIDVHHHLVPPKYLSDISAKLKPNPPLVAWSPARSIEDMDKAGVATSINSITEPGVWFGNAEEARRIARECNEYAARLAQDYPGRYGSFAALPMQDTDGALKEIEYALDTLRADGVCLFTNYGDKWLGDKSFAPVLEELNRRKDVVYTHPMAANCCRNLVPDVRNSVIEFATDTTRTIANLLFSGTASRLHDMHLIFSHAGGTMPFLLERLTLEPRVSKFLNERMPNGVLHELRRFYYDTAQASYPNALFPLLRTVPVSQVLFGTDFPFRDSEEHVRGIRDYGLNAADSAAIEYGNATRLLPRLKA